MGQEMPLTVVPQDMGDSGASSFWEDESIIAETDEPCELLERRIARVRGALETLCAALREQSGGTVSLAEHHGTEYVNASVVAACASERAARATTRTLGVLEESALGLRAAFQLQHNLRTQLSKRRCEAKKN